jgi:hypothetical protein
MLYVNELGAMPFTGGRVIVPLAVPKRVLPSAKVYVKSPLKRAPVAGLTQLLSCVVNAPRLEVPVPMTPLINRFGGAPHRWTFGAAGGIFAAERLPVKVMVSARVTADAPTHSRTEVSVMSTILLS